MAPPPLLCRAVAGVLEYWSASDYSFPSDVVDFKFKLDTDLYVLAKVKAVAHSLEVSRDGAKFVVMSSDRWGGGAWQGMAGGGGVG